MNDEQITDLFMGALDRNRGIVRPAVIEMMNDSVKREQALQAEIERLHSWGGLMSLLDEHWPEEMIPTVADNATRDAGARIVSLIRWVSRLSPAGES